MHTIHFVSLPLRQHCTILIERLSSFKTAKFFSLFVQEKMEDTLPMLLFCHFHKSAEYENIGPSHNTIYGEI